MMVDLAQHYDQGPVQIRDIARRQDISVKYLEQLIIPLKKAGLIASVRGAKGGHLLSKPPGKITAADIVRVLEHDHGLVPCLENPELCQRVAICPTRNLWIMATRALYDHLNSVTLAELVESSSEHQVEKDIVHVF